MKVAQYGSLTINTVLALLAGVLGSLFILLLSNSLRAPVVGESGPVVSMDQADSQPVLSGTLHTDPTIPLADESEAHNEAVHNELRAELVAAAEERAQLAKVIAQMTVRLEAMESDAINRHARDNLEGGDKLDALHESTQIDEPRLARFNAPTSAQDRIDTLVASGLEHERAADLQSRQNQFQLARLDLFDQAEREGWIDSEQFEESLSALDEQRPNLREELGDEGYDRFLYEAGHNNRVVVSSIIPGSSAETVGLQPGDMILSYAQERVFSTDDLQSATRAGQRGESIVMQLERQGQNVFVDVPRGPLGIGLSAEQKNPF